MLIWTVRIYSLPYDIPGPALFERETFKHKIIKMGPGIYDEVFELNPQSSSQWDGFRHVSTCSRVQRTALPPSDPALRY